MAGEAVGVALAAWTSVACACAPACSPTQLEGLVVLSPSAAQASAGEHSASSACSHRFAVNENESPIPLEPKMDRSNPTQGVRLCVRACACRRARACVSVRTRMRTRGPKVSARRSSPSTSRLSPSGPSRGGGGRSSDLAPSPSPRVSWRSTPATSGRRRSRTRPSGRPSRRRSSRR